MNIVIGTLLLTLGRKLFWLFVALTGVVVGFRLAEAYLPTQPNWMVLLAGLAGGLLGALLALFFQKVAIGVAGFLTGSAVMTHFAVLFDWAPILAIQFAGGVVGAILLYLIFDWGLIVLSSVAGATLIVQTVNWTPAQEMVLYIGLIVAGILIQARLMRMQ
ncbi:MAG: hypothetical protein VR64_20635 [Desulfatitalea sp. BRH_c12]|nr:MAG: hypothetical protein VR64_20635 [Desulfatitalea sp. BRH_c12]